MVDLGSVKNGYHMDETRMFAIGSMPQRAYRASRAAIDIHDTLIERAKPGVALGELFDQGLTLADRMGFRDVFLGPNGHQVNFIGHGIGIELIEPPIIARGREPLEAGMVFALEPSWFMKTNSRPGRERLLGH